MVETVFLFHSSLRVNGTANIGIASREVGRICSASVVPEPSASRRKDTASATDPRPSIRSCMRAGERSTFFGPVCTRGTRRTII